jgi:hypothetical protein
LEHDDGAVGDHDDSVAARDQHDPVAQQGEIWGRTGLGQKHLVDLFTGLQIGLDPVPQLVTQRQGGLLSQRSPSA